MSHLSIQQIADGFSTVLESPRDSGRLEAIVIRPVSDKRELHQSAMLTPEGGVAGDKWAISHWQKLPDGKPDPAAQVSLMNSRILQLISGDKDRISLAGDNLIVDFDLSEANLAPGERLAVGEVVLLVSELPHTGCRKFEARYGKDAVRYINAPKGRSLRLRGLFARILVGGKVNVGDVVRKVP
jgi:MOSC domain-containing protein YiiM